MRRMTKRENNNTVHSLYYSQHGYVLLHLVGGWYEVPSCKFLDLAMVLLFSHYGTRILCEVVPVPQQLIPSEGRDVLLLLVDPWVDR